MKIGIISDTHDHETNLIHALMIFRDHGITRLFHCGDLTEPRMVNFFDGFQVVYVFGNVDSSREETTAAWRALHEGNWSGVFYSENIEGKRIAVTHGHLEGEVTSLAMSGDYQYVFHGHTHRHRDEVIGGTRVINPGAIGKAIEGYSVCILDTINGKARFVSIV